jgi:hypothetical protein
LFPHFEQAQLESIAACGANAGIGKDEEAGVFIVMFGIFEVIKGGDDGASRATCAAILDCDCADQLLAKVKGRRRV